VEGIGRLLPIAQQFYQTLYDTDPVDDDFIKQYLGSLRDIPKLTEDGHINLLEPITLDEILDETRRVINKVSSPGTDGLGYALLHQLFRYPPLQSTLVQVFNEALTSHVYPSSWQELRVRLLAKKGDLTSLANWRPISLINCDAKIFTRIMNSRIRKVIDKLINRCQTGFMPNRLIAENGLLLNIVMEHARQTNRTDIALLLDQEKAYDRVHPTYLRSVLVAFGFPPISIDSFVHLFFNNRVRININGHFTEVVKQR
jgi:hypothetical protein